MSTPDDSEAVGSAGPAPGGWREAENASTWRQIAPQAGLLALLALLVRLVQLDHAPHFDELYHVLAARSLLLDGTLQINGGESYDRGILYTYLVAGLFRVFGESLAAARIPSVVAGSALVLALFVWLSRVTNRRAAWAAALLLCFSPAAIYVSQFARFYALHALAFFLGALAMFAALGPRATPTRRIGLIVCAVAAFLFAYWLHVLTLVGLAGVVMWFAIAGAPAVVRWTGTRPSRRRIAIVMLLLAGVAAVFVLSSEVAARALGLMSHVDQWAEADRNEIRFYHHMMLGRYPTLWSLLPVLALVALVRHRRVAWFCIVPLVVSLVIQSLAAWKGERYAFFWFPFFFALAGVAIGDLFPRLVQLTRDVAVSLRVGPRLVGASASVTLAGVVLFVVASNSAFTTTLSMLTVSDGQWRSETKYRGEANWPGALPALSNHLHVGTVLVSSAELHAIYYLQRLDVILRTMRPDLDHRRSGEFIMEPTVARPRISTVASLDRVMRCNPTGLVVIDRQHWRQPFGVPAEVADFLVHHATPIVLSDTLKLIAFRWTDPPDFDDEETSCPIPGHDRARVAEGRAGEDRRGADRPRQSAIRQTVSRIR